MKFHKYILSVNVKKLRKIFLNLKREIHPLKNILDNKPSKLEKALVRLTSKDKKLNYSS